MIENQAVCALVCGALDDFRDVCRLSTVSRKCRHAVRNFISSQKRDFSGGLEAKPIRCENTVDAEPYPLDFQYVSNCVLPSGCAEFLDGKMQKRRPLELSLVLKKTRHKGWGVFASEVIEKDTFICDYIGEVVSNECASSRFLEYDACPPKCGHALLVVREILPSGKNQLRTNIDATKYGNIARFFNHSCDGGNLVNVVERSLHSFLPVVAFYAQRDVQCGEELTFSYGNTDNATGNKSPNLLRPCWCGSELCKGFLPSEEV